MTRYILSRNEKTAKPFSDIKHGMGLSACTAITAIPLSTKIMLETVSENYWELFIEITLITNNPLLIHSEKTPPSFLSLPTLY